MSLDSKLEDKVLLPEWQQAFLDSSLLLISQCMQF